MAYQEECLNETRTIFYGSPNEHRAMAVSRNRGPDDELIGVIGGMNLWTLRYLSTLKTF